MEIKSYSLIQFSKRASLNNLTIKPDKRRNRNCIGNAFNSACWRIVRIHRAFKSQNKYREVLWI
jgi:hypothetical protein